MPQPGQTTTDCPTQPIPKLCGVMLEVTDRNDLMLELGAGVPRETTFWLEQVKGVYGTVNHAVADVQERLHLGFGIGFWNQWQRTSFFCGSWKAILVLHIFLVLLPRI